LQTEMIHIPRDSVVFVRESIVPRDSWNVAASGPRPTAEVETREAPEIARVIGDNVRIVSAADYLKCDRYNCATSTRFAVVVVRPAGQLPQNRYASITATDARWAVNVHVYLPGAAPDGSERIFSAAQIRLERRANGWIGVQYIGGSKGRPVRIPRG